ncbi:hypothetical protein HAX54_052870, partial [Datura stramonium]|nr:hypothetical protein [Datura stramonium]
FDGETDNGGFELEMRCLGYVFHTTAAIQDLRNARPSLRGTSLQPPLHLRLANGFLLNAGETQLSHISKLAIADWQH